MTQRVAVCALLAFVLLMVFIGVWSFKRARTMKEFLLGGRNIGAWMSAFAYGTSYFSAVIFIGYAGKTGWGIGLGGIWIGIGNAILGSLVAWLVLARRTRVMTHTLGAATMPEFFQKRYDSPKLKYMAAIIIFVFLLPYSASVYMGLGYLFNSIFPSVDYVYCMLFIAVLTAVYLVLGGYTATTVTDFIQGLIMIAGVIAMIVCIVTNPTVGGVTNGLAKLREIDPNLTSLTGGSNWFSLLTLILLTSFGTWGLPQMIHKFYAIRDQKSITKATVISTLFAAIVGTGAYFVGTFGRLYLNNTLPAEGFDKVVPDMLMAALSDGVLSNIVLSVVLLCVLSASMSTLSSIVLTSSSAISVDLLKALNPSIDKKKQMRVMRLLCLVFVALSFLFASLEISFIISLMSFSWGIVSGCFLGPYIYGLYWKKTTRAGAFAGMCSGLIVVLGLALFETLTAPGGFSDAMANASIYGVLAMAVSVIVVPVVSVFTRKLPEECVKKAFADIG